MISLLFKVVTGPGETGYKSGTARRVKAYGNGTLLRISSERCENGNRSGCNPEAGQTLEVRILPSPPNRS